MRSFSAKQKKSDGGSRKRRRDDTEPPSADEEQESKRTRRQRITGKRRLNAGDEVRDRRDRGRSKRRRRDDECLDSVDGDAASDRSGSGRSVESRKSASPTPSAPRAAGRSYSSYLEMREASPPAPHPVARPPKQSMARTGPMCPDCGNEVLPGEKRYKTTTSHFGCGSGAAAVFRNLEHEDPQLVESLRAMKKMSQHCIEMSWEMCCTRSQA